jgi:hypothetical protein
MQVARDAMLASATWSDLHAKKYLGMQVADASSSKSLRI